MSRICDQPIEPPDSFDCRKRGQYAVAPASKFWATLCPVQKLNRQPTKRLSENQRSPSYGEFVNNADQVGEPGTTAMPALQGHFDPLFRGFDLDYTDVARARRFIEELLVFEKSGAMPQLIRSEEHTSE